MQHFNGDVIFLSYLSLHSRFAEECALLCCGRMDGILRMAGSSKVKLYHIKFHCPKMATFLKLEFQMYRTNCQQPLRFTIRELSTHHCIQ